MTTEECFKIIAECLIIVAGMVLLMCGAGWLLLSILVGAAEQRQWRNGGVSAKSPIVVRVRMAKPPSESGVPRL